jgi:hypothetical protein
MRQGYSLARRSEVKMVGWYLANVKGILRFFSLGGWLVEVANRLGNVTLRVKILAKIAVAQSLGGGEQMAKKVLLQRWH